MDASRFKRRSTQTQRHINNLPTEGFTRPQNPQFISRRPASIPVSQHQQVIQEIAPQPWQTPPIQEVQRPAPYVPAPETNYRFVAPTSSPTPTPPAKAQIDMELPGGTSQSNALRKLVERGRWFAIRKWAIRGVVTAVILVVAIGGVLFSQGAFKAHKVFSGTKSSAVALKENVNPELLKGEGDGRINILLMGRGGGKHDAPDLTDTMILASIDPVNKTQSLVSIPRDLWVTTPAGGSMKINAVWETGEFKHLGKVAPGSTDPKAIQSGFTAADQIVESVLGVPVNYNVIVDFAAFEKAVGTVGGVTVNAPTDLVDPTMAWQNNKSPIIAKAGVNNFSGPQALNYVRSRETTSDFARSQRQRAVMLALKAKLDNLGTLSNPLKLSSLINDFGNNVSTDMSISNAQRLYSILGGINESATSSIGLADKPNNYVTTGTIKGQSIDLPTAGMGNYTAIQNYIHSQLRDGYITKENAKILVYNGTQIPGVATLTADKLKSYGYNVVGAANAPNTGWSQTIIANVNGGNKYTQRYLEQRYKTKAVSKLPDATIPTNGADFAIIIGSDAATSP